MKSEVEKNYTKVAEMIYDIVPDNFQDAYFHMEISDDVWGGEIFYRTNGKEFRYANESLESIVEEIKRIRRVFESSGDEPFTVATAVLKNTGKFFLEFEYDDISDFGRASERRDDWINKYLGKDAEIDWC